MTRTLEPVVSPSARAEWTKCTGCDCLIYHKRLDRNAWVCPECEHHLRMGARARIESLADDGSFRETEFAPLMPDPLEFSDSRSYRERLADATAKSGESEAVIVGAARIGDRDVILAVMEFSFMGGSMGVEVGRRVSEAAALALEARKPLIVVCASGGARMQEGVFSLLQMARTAVAFAQLREAGVLSVCVLTDPTYGGVSASFASLGSVVIAERGAHVGFAGPRVVQETIRAELPAGFQAAESQLLHGLVDRVENRADLRSVLIRLIDLHAGQGVRTPAASDPAGVREAAATRPPGCGVRRDSWAAVQAARNVDRPTTADYVRLVFDDFVELHGDRAFADDPAIIGGVACVAGRPVVVIGTQKGHTVKELVAHNFGMAHPEGYRKVMRLMEHAESFGLPLVTFIDTPGAHPGPDAEERGQSIAIAETIMRSARLRVPVVAVITGEGGSGGALALCTSDRLLVLENAFLSVISPEGCAAILWRSASSAPAAAGALQLGASQLLGSGIATAVVPEPADGAHADPAACARTLRDFIIRDLEDLRDTAPADLLSAREQRFSGLGAAAPVTLTTDIAS
ncbi:acetyl-CoA carboxylase carboxyl transferase subunit alpha [Microbacterium trichothecenolyticum]|uniref:acetyl-CoA carboxylase carboxyl transferase subunit alpha n=1 Tax=Microbacterium trichothecenolyticum TaxID=69370 RepID=UPI0035BE39CE